MKREDITVKINSLEEFDTLRMFLDSIGEKVGTRYDTDNRDELDFNKTYLEKPSLDSDVKYDWRFYKMYCGRIEMIHLNIKEFVDFIEKERKEVKLQETWIE